jgi:cyclopropane-fatty-acyl-phospholipid synthase
MGNTFLKIIISNGLNRMEALIRSIFSKLGITKNDCEIVSNNFYRRLDYGGNISLMMGEAYMAGEWVSRDLAAFLRKVNTFPNPADVLYVSMKEFPLETSRLMASVVFDDINDQFIDTVLNGQSIQLSQIVGEQHYDIPDILYECMLDSDRQYTCAYWKQGVSTLREAQLEKIALLIDKLQIPDNTPMNILDIGCGWGGLTNAISRRYPRCNIEGISISAEQINYANKTYGSPALKYIFCDYRELPNKNKKYDRIISVGMFEHVGIKNFDDFFSIFNEILTDNGIFVLHTITKPIDNKYMTGFTKYTADKWITKYIFPGGYIPTTEQISASFHSQGLMYHHIQNLSISYAKTLKAWDENFIKHWKYIQSSDPVFFTPSFYNMWRLYLMTAMVAFELKQIQLTQYVLTKMSYPRMYVLRG